MYQSPFSPNEIKYFMNLMQNDNADVSIREVTLGGDPIEDFVSYHPNIGASDDELTKICDDIYQTLMGAFVAQMMEIA